MSSDFDWVTLVPSGIVSKYQIPASIIGMNVEAETPYDRKLRMLVQLSHTCISCSMCELGLKVAERGNEKGKLGLDPHLLSNLNPKRIMLVGQNPGWNELRKRTPFIGEAGQNFDAEIAKHNVTRDDFYICNAVRCYTTNNERPTAKHLERCAPFLHIEINLIKPKLVVALGAVAFEQLCPDAVFSEALNKITKSKKFGVNVFAVYHPSPLNLNDQSRRTAFENQIAIMCGLVNALREKENPS